MEKTETSAAVDIAVATFSGVEGWPKAREENEHLLAALARAGARAAAVAWDDPHADWGRYRAVVLRTPWDYCPRVTAFRAWAAEVDRVSRLVNPSSLVVPNSDKRYLARLEAGGVRTVPTTVLEPGDGRTPGALLAGAGVGRGVLKPVVGAGSRGLLVFGAGDLDRAGEHLDALRRGNADGPDAAIFQPFLPRISAGELSLVFLAGALSHAVRKTPAAGDVRAQKEHGASYSIDEPSDAELDLARRALAAWDAAPVYARLDLVELEPGVPAIMEVELIEPELFLNMVPGAADRLARAVLGSL